MSWIRFGWVGATIPKIKVKRQYLYPKWHYPVVTAVVAILGFAFAGPVGFLVTVGLGLFFTLRNELRRAGLEAAEPSVTPLPGAPEDERLEAKREREGGPVEK